MKIDFTDTHITLDFTGDDEVGRAARTALETLIQKRAFTSTDLPKINALLDDIYDKLYFNINQQAIAQAKDHEELDINE